jgi:mono/diheme cytochrome c family protein
VKRLRLLSILAALILAGSAGVAQNKEGSAGNPEKGKKLWVADGCYSCHGFDGHGGAGPKLAPKPIPLPAFVAIVRRPPPSGMPSFSAKYVADSDLQDMWAYLKTIRDPPAVKDIPLLNQ